MTQSEFLRLRGGEILKDIDGKHWLCMGSYAEDVFLVQGFFLTQGDFREIIGGAFRMIPYEHYDVIGELDERTD